MKIDLTELNNLRRIKTSDIKSEIDDFCISAQVAEIEYWGGLKVTVLKLAQSYIITYKMSVRTWTSNCISTEAVIKDVKENIKILEDTKILPTK